MNSNEEEKNIHESAEDRNEGMQLKSATQFSSYPLETPVLAIIEAVAPMGIAPMVVDEKGIQGTVQVAFVFDTSKSMTSVIPQLNDILRFILKTTPSNIETTLISFNSYPTVEWPLTKMSSEAKLMLHSKCNLRAIDSTNIDSALQVAINQLKVGERNNPLASRIIILLSDGAPTIGVLTAKDMLKKYDKYPIFKKIQICTLGLGNEVDTKLLTELAVATKGRFYHLKNEEDMCRALGDCIGSAVSIVAGDVSIIVTPFRDDECHSLDETQFVIGLMYAEDTRSVLVEIPKDCSGYKARMHYVNAATGLPCIISKTFPIDRSGTGNGNGTEHPEVAVQLLRIECQQAITMAQETGEIHELKALYERLRAGPYYERPLIQYIIRQLDKIIQEANASASANTNTNTRNSLSSFQVTLVTQQTTCTDDSYGTNRLRRQYSHAYTTTTDLPDISNYNNSEFDDD